MMQDEIRIPWQPLKEFAKEVFIRMNTPPNDAEEEADTLIWANLRGVDSHGVLRIPWYVENIDNGVMNPKPNIQVIKETPSTLLIEADHALGPVVTIFAINKIINKAKNSGIAWALIRNHTHQGAIGYYSQMIAHKGMAGIIFVCSPPNMAPYGARTAGVSNSPISIAVPGKRKRPLILDMATSVVAGGKLFLAIDQGVLIPEGWTLDKDGNPTTDPRQSAALLPMSGPKGSGLALMLECLGSLMADKPLLESTPYNKEEDPPPNASKKKAIGIRPQHVRRNVQNSVVAAIDIATFTDLQTYKKHVDNLVDELKALPKAKGFSEIFVPGEIEDKTFEDRSRYGIPLSAGTIRNLQRIAERFNVELPRGL